MQYNCCCIVHAKKKKLPTIYPFKNSKKSHYFPPILFLQGSLATVNELIDDVHDARLSPHRLIDVHHTLRNSQCVDVDALNTFRKAN